MISRSIIQKGSKYYKKEKNEKLELVDADLPFLNYGNLQPQKINVHYVIYAEKVSVNPTDSTYPKYPQSVVDPGTDEHIILEIRRGRFEKTFYLKRKNI